MPGLTAEATAQEYKRAEEDLYQEMVNRAQRQISGVQGGKDVHVRDILPDEDLESGADNGWNGTDHVWLQSGLSADANNETYEIDPDAKADGKLIGFYAIEAQQADPNTTELTFEDGTGSQFERLMFQEAHGNGNATEVVALMRNPIIIDEGMRAVIQQWADNAADDELIFHGLVVEKAGTTLGTRSQGESAPTGTARQVA